ncbi:hypothetical protein B0T16DRAFT_423463 [Cercophora newfieldiana]|uniref:Uncharacterized protein n=1 Tax=Cercophora newfieldiana TaxID=92897 RepID=A0AA39XSU1_9PEZI|nr:hypothetical protein B0T16DRAFT_423463 [Cercophora newfieldiana]
MDKENLVAKAERRHPEPTCKHLAAGRQNQYRNIPFDKLLPLALYTTVADIQRLGSSDVEHLARIASQRHAANKGDFFKALFKYCKSLNSPLQQAAALFEGATHLSEKAIEVLSNSDSPVNPEYEHWVLVSRTLLKCLHDVDDSATLGLMLSNWHIMTLQRFLGDFLCVGFNTSCMRIQEAGGDLTTTACLHASIRPGEDARFDIQIGLGVGLAISQLLSAGDDLQEVLGAFLYSATRSSMMKPAVRLEWGGMACKLELMLGYHKGLVMLEAFLEDS